MTITKKEKAHEELSKYSDRQIVTCILDSFTFKELQELLFKLKRDYS